MGKVFEHIRLTMDVKDYWLHKLIAMNFEDKSLRCNVSHQQVQLNA